MDKKSFLRGFGIGVLFVSIILGISCLMRTSNSSIISRAKKLGMTFEQSDTKIVLSTVEPASNTAISGENKNNNKNNSEKPKESNNVSKKNSDDKSFEEEKKKMKKNLEEEKEKLTINSGDWAKKVADKLENKGVIENSDEFVDYMKENDYAGKIRAGEYEFEKDEDFSEIAKMITKQK